MKVFAKVFLVGHFLFAPLLSQVPNVMQRETYGEYGQMVVTSPEAKLWREIVVARESGNETLEATLVQQFTRQFPGRLSLVQQAMHGATRVQTREQSSEKFDLSGRYQQEKKGNFAFSPTALAFYVVPPAYAGTAGPATFNGPLATAERTYQLLIHDSLLTNLIGQRLTALSWRLPSSATANWPTAEVVYNNYDVFLSGSVAPANRSLTFADNVVGTRTQVRSGSLTIPTDAYPSGGSPNGWGPEITFTTPWVYSGGHLLVEIRQSGFTGTSRSTDAIGTTTVGYGTAFSACWTGSYAGTSGAQGNFTILRLTGAPAGPTHDIGVSSVARTSASDNSDWGRSPIDPADGATKPVEDLSANGHALTFFSASVADTARFRAVVTNYGTFPETTYQVRWTADGVVQSTLSNTRILAPAARDTFTFQWNTAAVGSHVVRAWTLLATDTTRVNDTATVNFTITTPGANDGAWTSLPATPNAVSRSCVAYVKIADTGYVYQFGGGAGAQLNAVARFNTRTNTWTNTGFAPIPGGGVSAGAAVAIRDSNIYLFGHQGSVNVGNTWVYNVYTNIWTTLATMTKGITDAAVVKWRDSLIYVIGGGSGVFTAGPTTTDTVQVYNIRTNSYSLATNYPLKVGMAGFGIFKDTIIVAGGWNGTAAVANAYKGIINPSNPLQIAWTPVAAYPNGAVTRMASAYVTKGGGAGVLFAGGAIGGSLLTAKAYIWNFCTSSWSPLDTFAVPRSNMKAAGAGDSAAYVVAGFTTVGVGATDRFIFTRMEGTCNLSIPAATEQRRDHVTSAFRATVTNEGTIGSLNAYVGTGPGSGFQFNPIGTQRLFGDGIMIALDSTRVSDGARNNAATTAYDADFKFLTTIDSVTTGNRTTMTTSFTDSLAETPFGVRVNQRTVSWDSAGINNFLIYELDVVNTSATQWTTLHVGALLDWDVEPSTGADRGAVIVDSTNTIPGINGGNPFAFDLLELHQGATANSWMGVVPLNENRFHGRRIAISTSEIYATAHMTNGDKWRYMIGNRATNPNGDGGSAQDHAQVFGVGPYTVAASATKRVGFAMFGGTSLANAVAAARAAQRAWVQRLGNAINVVTTGVDQSAGLPEVFELSQNYPNPFNPATTIRYALPENSRVNLSIYNMLGQRIAELTNDVQAAGFYNVVWDGRNATGSQVATGVYFYRIEATPVNGGAPFKSLKKALLLK